ncbi:facilitated trehalose transporter Tret1 isoform X1 [Ceratitis capitata]|uniref:facilitated trehalose transporter Tret1 isoform X1 n=1 Tax=Ceratitis capitata TaxID=7213 RepID=UPI00032A2BBE|nr:facilitated trehalose transporter Tret1 isoform X1 [Ceratitis capitata]
MCLPKDLKGVTIQRIATIVGNILCLNFGIMFGITPAHVQLYVEEQTPLNHVNSEDAVTWIFGCLFASAALSSVLCGFFTQNIGPRALLLLSGLLQIGSWFCVHFAYDIVHIYSSRILGGFAAGASLSVLPIYIAEISEESSSPALIATIEQWRTIGVLIGCLLGQHLQYEYVAVVAVCISCAFTIMFPFSQESPYYYMRKGDVMGLEKSLRWFRGVRRMSDRNRPEFVRELDEFKRGMERHIIAQDLVSHTYLCKMAVYTLVLFVGVQLSGTYVILAWSNQILTNDVFVGFSIDISVTILALTQFIGATIAVWLATMLKRKICLFVSAFVCGLATICLAIFIAVGVRGHLQWLSSALLLIHIFFANFGMYSLLSLIPSEMLDTKLRVSLTSISWGVSWLVTFILIQYFECISTIIGLHGYFIIFGVGCTAVAMLALVGLPETLGKPLAEIQQIMGFRSESEVSKNSVPQSGRINLERY